MRLTMQTKHTLKTTDGVTLTYFRWRATNKPRPLIVLLHGLGSNHTRWLEFIETSKLTDQWDIIAPDLRGHSESLTRGKITLEIWAHDLHAVLEQEQYQNAVIIGHSLGAHAALMFYKLYPRELLAMVFIDPLSRRGFTPKMRWMWRLRSMGYFMIALIHACNRIGIKRRHIPLRDLRDFDSNARKLIAQGKQKEMVKRYSSPWIDFKYNPLANYFQYTYEILRPLPQFTQNDLPVLLLLSAGSTYHQGELQHPLSTQFVNCTVCTIHCNHWPLTEKPQEVHAAINAWLSALMKNTALNKNA